VCFFLYVYLLKKLGTWGGGTEENFGILRIAEQKRGFKIVGSWKMTVINVKDICGWNSYCEVRWTDEIDELQIILLLQMFFFHFWILIN